jgi:hypothetical protein
MGRYGNRTELRGTRGSPMHPLTVNLPFNRESLQGRFVFGKNPDSPEDRVGHWLLLQAQSLFVCEYGTSWRVPRGPCRRHSRRSARCALAPIWVTLAGQVRSSGLESAGISAGEPLTDRARLTDDVFLGGLAHQAIHWETTSRRCPRCGSRRSDSTRGEEMLLCAYEHYPHLHPACA